MVTYCNALAFLIRRCFKQKVEIDGLDWILSDAVPAHYSQEGLAIYLDGPDNRVYRVQISPVQP